MKMTTIRTARLILIILIIGAAYNTAIAVTENRNPQLLPYESHDPLRLIGKTSQQHEFWSPMTDNGAINTQWQAFRYGTSGSVSMSLGKPIPLLDKDSAEEEVRNAVMAFIIANAVDLNVEGCEVTFQSTRQVRGNTIVVVQPEVDGIPVYGGFIVASVSAAGNLTSIKARTYGSNASGSFSSSEEEAVKQAGVAAGLTGTDLLSSQIERTLYPAKLEISEIILRRAYEVVLSSERPDYLPVIIIDAENDNVLAADNRVFFDRLDGSIQGTYWPHYANEDAELAGFENERLSIAGQNGFSDPNGEFSFEFDNVPATITSELRGRWVNVDYEDGDDASLSQRVESFDAVALTWDEDNSRGDERNLYYHVNFIHDWWKELDENFDELDYAMRATCQVGDNYDNAYWNGQGIFFGGGAEMDNFAMYSDIIYHEYGHAVTAPGIYRWDQLPYRDESGALNEAWSDYFPCSISNEPLMGEGGLRGGGYIRNLDNNLVYPYAIQGEVHRDSRIISAAMWHTREVLGSEVTDPLFHLARYHLGTDFLTYFTDVLLTDDDNGDITDGTPHDLTLYDKFGIHGIGPGLSPRIQITQSEMHDDNRFGADGNQDYIWEPGETVRIDVEIFRDGTLFPPPIEDVRVSLSTHNISIELVQSEIEFGNVYVADRVQGAEPLLFRIDEDAPLSFAKLFLSVTTEDQVIDVDTIDLALGRPELLLMRDGAEEDDMTEWFTSSLDEIGAIYSVSSTATPALTLDETLRQYKSVIWFTGDDREDILEPEARFELEYFLYDGGNLLLTGQSIDRVENADLWFEENFGVEHITDSLHNVLVEGVQADPISDSLSVLLLGSRGARNQNRPSGLRAVNDGIEIFHWANADNRPAAGVRREDPDFGSRTVYLGFGVEGIGNHGLYSTRREVLTRVLDWFEVPHSVGSDDAAPTTFFIDPAYPNPFNGTINIPFRVARSGLVTMSAYDLNGRLVWNGSKSFESGASTWSVDASKWGAGSYVVKMETVSESGVSLITLIK